MITQYLWAVIGRQITVLKTRIFRLKRHFFSGIFLELKQMFWSTLQVRELHHVNLCQVVGVCIQAPNVCILNQYCSKGSLQDVLQNNDYKLDRMFKMSFANDIACGLLELHRNSIVHGKLNSNNCVIDNRWVSPRCVQNSIKYLRRSVLQK